jgi:Na+-transporting NADH:ubiquinone oxidoreductase subunit NqrC
LDDYNTVDGTTVFKPANLNGFGAAANNPERRV